MPLPADAMGCGRWGQHGEQGWRRYFLVREWCVAGVSVIVAGEQHGDGRVTRQLVVSGEARCARSDVEDLVSAVNAAALLLDSLSATP